MAAHDTLTPARAKKALDRAGIKLADRQLEMLYYYVSGHDKATACRMAGYPETASWTLFNRPKMREAIPLVIDAFLIEDASPAALRALYRIVSDDKSPAGVRVQAANSILDRAGFNAKRHENKGELHKDMSQMSAVEIEEQIRKLQQAIDDRLRDVTPDDEPAPAQDLDLYE
jgi:hypothetical protein